jgi:Right handed beta helix region
MAIRQCNMVLRRATLTAGVLLALIAARDGRAATISVASVEQLQQAVESARDGDDIVVQPSLQAYAPTAPLAVSAKITIRGTSEAPVVLSGGGLEGAGQSIVSVNAGASLTLKDVTVQTGAVDGAAITVDGELLLDSSTLSGNSGPAVLVQPTGTAVVRNSTIGDNLNVGLVAMGKARLENSTIAGNGFYGILADGGEVSLANTIVASNGNGSSGGDCDLPVKQSSTSLDSDGSCGVGALSGRDPQLAPLMDNGGTTRTRAIAPGSPAADAGTGCPQTDQRRAARARACDIGAFELGGTVPPLPAAKPPLSLGSGAPGAATAPTTTPAPKTPPVALTRYRVKTSFTLGGKQGAATLRLQITPGGAAPRLFFHDTQARLRVSVFTLRSLVFNTRTATLTLKGIGRDGLTGKPTSVSIVIVDRRPGDGLTLKLGSSYRWSAILPPRSLALTA